MRFKNKIPFVSKGLGLIQDRFHGGRIGITFAGHGGISEVVYHGNQHAGAKRFFTGNIASAWTKLFRMYVVIDNKMFYPGFSGTELFPFGYSSRYHAGRGLVLRHEMVLLNDSIVQRVIIESNPDGKKIRLRMLHHETVTRVEIPNRTWNSFSASPLHNSMIGTVIDENPLPPKADESLTQQGGFQCHDAPHAETFIAISSDHPVAVSQPGHGFKNYIETDEFDRQAAVFVIFEYNEEILYKRLKQLRRHVHQECDALLDGYHHLIDTGPVISIGNTAADSALANFPATMAALRVKDINGGICASACGYWIWGWDSIVSADAVCLAGHTAFAKKMLFFFKDAADPELGIPHRLTCSLKADLKMAFPAQCLYILLLYHYYIFTGDIQTVKKLINFASWIVNRTLEDSVASTGLVKGVSLFPDYPEMLGEDGCDISSFNNSIFYQALRAMSLMAKETGDIALSSYCDQKAQLCREGFAQLLFDKNHGYFVTSCSARTLMQRSHYPIFAILWQSPFAEELVQGRTGKIAAFMRKNFCESRWFPMFPRWDSCFMADGNQIGAYMPATDMFYCNMMRMNGDWKELRKWIKIIGWYWDQHTIPEGLTCEAMNDGITLDSPGCKQFFSYKAWYGAVFSALAGISFSLEGIWVETSGLGGVVIQKIICRGLTINIQTVGDGLSIKSLTLNGVNVANNKLIPFSALSVKGPNTIVIKRKSNTKEPKNKR